VCFCVSASVVISLPPVLLFAARRGVERLAVRAEDQAKVERLRYEIRNGLNDPRIRKVDNLERLGALPVVGDHQIATIRADDPVHREVAELGLASGGAQPPT